jgi:hypothetical protein
METSAFYPELATHYPDYPWLTFDRALNTAARAACRLGLIWRVDLEPVSWVAGQNDYTLYPSVGTRVVQILRLGDLQMRTREQLNDVDKDWRTRTGAPVYYVPVQGNTVLVYRTPTADEDDAVTPFVALAPTIESKQLDDAYAWEYERLLLHGAIAHLGGANWMDFENECRKARERAADESQVGVLRTVKYGGY